ncbi:hypothetical protein JJB07_13540 [Tumebacillus sp. ITR2]|uniref:Uncharacterized protein n=1 Tax=Tumebacillus amylolyticus TaxID=2801339 RepID=A0ABS1JDH9_9BACL|nr:hypothetical protein [Tumebacillus amylolyticus]MBL0387658.1 hypothetical protein [Tumebacillus amylolyticus]
MSSPTRSRDIIAVVATDKKHLAGGKAQAFLADSDENCHKLTMELARALQGEVVSLSNGVYLILSV